MAMLESPIELLDIPAGEPTEFRVLRYEVGETVIVPRGGPAGKTVAAIRLHVPREDKPVGVPYWDVTAGNLIAQLKPLLPGIVSSRRRIRVTKHGQPPAARHQLDLL